MNLRHVIPILLVTSCSGVPVALFNEWATEPATESVESLPTREAVFEVVPPALTRPLLAIVDSESREQGGSIPLPGAIRFEIPDTWNMTITGTGDVLVQGKRVAHDREVYLGLVKWLKASGVYREPGERP